jgi:hypothetical protein
MKKSTSSLGNEALQKQPMKTRVLFLPLVIMVGGLVTGISLWFFSDEKQYVCGARPPSHQELELYPSCITIESSSSTGSPMPAQPLCLQADVEQDSIAPTWCYNSIFDRTTPLSYYLYWLSSDDESSWRLYEEPTSTEESWYKLTADVLSSELPQSGDDWLAWKQGEWETTDITISVCSEEDETAIPDVCYQDYPRMDKENPHRGMAKAALFFMFLFGVGFVYSFLGTICCFDDGSTSRRSTNYTQDGPKRERTSTADSSLKSVPDDPTRNRAVTLGSIPEDSR